MSATPSGSRLRRRDLLASAAAVLLTAAAPARAETVQGGLPWRPNAGDPPPHVGPGPWIYFTPEEGAAIEAIVDRLVPPDPQWAGGKDAGCAVFIDRQLAGPYGRSEGLYVLPPFHEEAPSTVFGPQTGTTPAQRYRAALRALADHVRQAYAGKAFPNIPPTEQDKLLRGLEKNEVRLDGTDGQQFFKLVHQNTMEGFFADPVYGGNRDMVSWRMIGFPGARYDYRDWVDRHNERYPLPPVGIGGRPEWQPQKS